MKGWLGAENCEGKGSFLLLCMLPLSFLQVAKILWAAVSQ